jgi:hypothetical protein
LAAAGENFKIDIGLLDKNLRLFVPRLYQYKSKFGEGGPSKDGEHWGCVEPGQTLTYCVYFVCDQFISPDYDVKIEWDGQFSEKRKELSEHLNVTLVRTTR